MKRQDKLPSFLEQYFWDADFGTIDRAGNSRYVIGRVLEYGDKKALRWLFANYSLNEIKEVVCKTRALSLRSLFFWALFLNLDKRKVKCLRKPYLEQRKTHWPY